MQLKLAMKNYCFVLVFLLFTFCKEKGSISEISSLNEDKPTNIELVIVFDRNQKNTDLKSFGNDFSKNFYFKRINFDPPFDDPNLHISIFHGSDKGKKIILRKDLDQMTVWFDSEMGYMDWFRLNFEKYYIIYQDEYLVKGSLHPDFGFQAWEVHIATGGVE